MESAPRLTPRIKSSPPERKIESMPPNLEEFIPEDRLPYYIDVYDNDNGPGSKISRLVLPERPVYRHFGLSGLNLETWTKFLERNPVRFVRRFPWPSPASIFDFDKGANGNDPKSTSGYPKIGQIDLRNHEYLGSGNHSYVALAPLTLPSTTDAPPVHGAVAVKLALFDEGELLMNEAKIYCAFPRELQEDRGFDLPSVVPKSYGYYQASHGAFESQSLVGEFTNYERKEICKVLQHVSTFLLIEHCGVQIDPLVGKEQEPVLSLFKRLHEANFVQGSPSPRNVVVQPGPLTVPKGERSLHKPSYRILDFGRGLSADFGIGRKHPEFLAERKEAEMKWAQERLSLNEYF
ncbi:hypothetical protein B0F90DRAFT_1794481 [Multifurca ochricompacta]|uniref:Protein kinase domain-containing protein n=1 Tax=Multifurca ochricompacta TaxID=376703 RepID=A0AAD4LVN8_9AGAM|nr:hypothetical protein B0F90DRAFT_1794481 [Multifurca ochricompacta]